MDDGISLGLGRVYSVKGLHVAGRYDPNKMSFMQLGDGMIDGGFITLVETGQ